MNPYIKAINQLIRPMFQYDYDHIIPLYGFGASIPSMRIQEQRNFFKVVGRGEGQNIPYSAEMAMALYKSAFTYIKGSEPTIVCPSLKGTIDWVNEELKVNQYLYTLLVTFTDGLIDDLAEAVKLIEKSQNLPVSFIYVIVSNNKESSLRKLVKDNTTKENSLRRQTSNLFDNLFVIDASRYENSPVEFVDRFMFAIRSHIVSFCRNRALVHQTSGAEPQLTTTEHDA